jgi:hypothetical protein
LAYYQKDPSINYVLRGEAFLCDGGFAMGNGRWTADDWSGYVEKNVSGKTSSQIFTSNTIDSNFDPNEIDFRESCDSPLNPSSTPVIIACDVTGSMGMISHTLMKTGLNTLATEIYNRKPVSDPHILVMAVGDAKTDKSPLQVTEFEADICLADQVKSLWIESGGGGNGGESYSLAHLFAATKTKIDSSKKRNQKGFLFTIGDEPIHDGLSVREMKRVLGLNMEADLSAADCVAMAQRNWEIFHIVLSNEGAATYKLDRVLETWHAILPDRTILLEDVSKLAETVISIMQIHQGADSKTVIDSWGSGTSVVVSNALKSVPNLMANKSLKQIEHL